MPDPLAKLSVSLPAPPSTTTVVLPEKFQLPPAKVSLSAPAPKVTRPATMAPVLTVTAVLPARPRSAVPRPSLTRVCPGKIPSPTTDAPLSSEMVTLLPAGTSVLIAVLA